MKHARLFPVFSVAFIGAYGLIVLFNLPVFTYRPSVNQYFWFVPPAVKGIPGIPMFWYGWILTALIVASIVTAICSLVPEQKSYAVFSWLVWAAPIFSICLVLYALRMWVML